MHPELQELYKKAQGKYTMEAVELKKRVLRHFGFSHPQELKEMRELAEKL